MHQTIHFKGEPVDMDNLEHSILDEVFNVVTQNLDVNSSISLGEKPATPFPTLDHDVAVIFHAYQRHVLTTSGKLQVDTQLYEITSLSHILILKPDQYSQSMINYIPLSLTRFLTAIYKWTLQDMKRLSPMAIRCVKLFALP